MHLASLNRRSENVVVEPVIISELKLRNVQRKIFGAHVLASQFSNTFTMSDISQSLSVTPAAFASVSASLGLMVRSAQSARLEPWGRNILRDVALRAASQDEAE